MERVDVMYITESSIESERMANRRKRQRDHKMRSQMIGLKTGGKEEVTKQEGTAKSRGEGRGGRERLNNYGQNGRIKKGGKAEGSTQGGRAKEST